MGTSIVICGSWRLFLNFGGYLVDLGGYLWILQVTSTGVGSGSGSGSGLGWSGW